MVMTSVYAPLPNTSQVFRSGTPAFNVQRSTDVLPTNLHAASELFGAQGEPEVGGHTTHPCTAPHGLVQSCFPFRFGNSITWVYDFRRGKQAGTCRCDGWRGCLLRKTQDASNRQHRCVFFWSSCAASCRGLLLLEVSTGRRTTKDLSA
jgi:hypothetical protein